MTDDVLKTKALEAEGEILSEVVVTIEDDGSFFMEDDIISDIILSKLQPLIDADRQETERLKKALRYYVNTLHHGDQEVARTALGEERPCNP